MTERNARRPLRIMGAIILGIFLLGGALVWVFRMTGATH